MIIKNDTQSILNSIRRIVQGLRISSKMAEREAGISGAQLFVLQKLASAKSLSLNELAERTLTHQSSVSVVVSRLVEQNLVVRTHSKLDARKIELVLTKLGRMKLKKIPPTAQEKMVHALEKMNPKERRELSRHLLKIVIEAGLAKEPANLFFEDEQTALKEKKKIKKKVK